MGRDGERIEEAWQPSISTHTPAWGVTGKLQECSINLPISTHTPAWGVTVQFAYDHIELYISTHTPA